LTGGIGMLCKGRGVEVITGTRATFVDANTVKLEGATTGTIKFQNAVIATGSVPTVPKAFALNDPRIMDSTGALLLPDIPGRL
jgi:dihydrolipoamide dehydrogenase